ncbi:MAG: hypothetical protein EP329_14420 [Deltaproteobacteria bacterium]|nr:MAG: hypothetical protein EP329_14420 [Deltaproteobacteria bacterium]
MRRRPARFRFAVGLAALLALSTSAPDAAAKDLSGRLGIGLEETLGGATGFALRYFFSEGVGVTSTLGVDITLVDGEDGQSQVATGFVGSFGVAVHFARSLHAHLGFGVRATFGYRSLEAAQLIDPAVTATDLQVALELPLILEFFLSDHFSVGASTGFILNFVPDSGSTLATSGAGGTRTPGAIGIGIGAGSIGASLAILYYF